jgi:Ca-activated chloride channel family protein
MLFPKVEGQERTREDAVAIKVAVNLVLLNVSVRDPDGRPVSNLQRSSFKVYDDGQLQEIAHFEEENTPLGVILLMDASSSMQGSPLEEARRAAREFIAQSHPRTEIAVLAFNDTTQVLQNFTSDRSQVRNAIDRLTARGGTAVYDALAKAITMMGNGKYARPIVVLLSDGKDEDSRSKFHEVEKLVQAGNTVIFAVGEYAESDRKVFMTSEKYYKPPALEVNLNPVWILRQLADLTGGAAYFPHTGESLSQMFTRIAREVQHQYVLGFSPAGDNGESKFHKIEVRVEGAGPLTVRTRKGYLSGGAAP